MEHHQHQLNPYTDVNPPEGSDHRLPQWSQAETKELLSIRSEFDQAFMETKRNKPLWESVASRMQLKGFNRTPDQCKSKWKNLVTRFKASEGMQFPFHDEMQRIYTERVERQLRDDVDDEEEIKKSKKKKKKKKKKGEDDGVEREVEGFLKELARHQRETEARWVAEEEAREAERRLKEEEWRRVMEAIWEERAAMERRCVAMEEERRAREEARAERHHALLTALINRLAP